VVLLPAAPGTGAREHRTAVADVQSETATENGLMAARSKRPAAAVAEADEAWKPAAAAAADADADAPAAVGGVKGSEVTVGSTISDDARAWRGLARRKCTGCASSIL
jgi:hypothetical protein